MATVVPPPKLALLSPSLHFKEDGEYSFSEKSLLFPHEALRREMTYAAKALEHFDPVKHPWKAHCFHNWLSTFFIPSIHGHHDLEEHCFFDYYKKLGGSIPEKQSADHKTLIEMLHTVQENSSKLLNLVILGGDNHEPVRNAVEALKSSYTDMMEQMLRHLAEEDAYWPAEVAKFGEATFKKCETLLIEYGRKHEGKTFENFACSVFYAAGVTVSGIPHREGDTCWAGEKTRKEIQHALPYPVRVLLLPGWNKRYQRCKTMIFSVCGDEDVLHVQDHQHGGCAPGSSCIIS